MKEKLKTSITIIMDAIAVFIITLSLLFYPSIPVKEKVAVAQEVDEPQEVIQLLCEHVIGRQGQQLNEWEIPIGRATDHAEYLADQVVVQAGIMAERAQNLIERTNELIGLAQQCGVNHCVPACCEETEYYGCDCSGCYTVTQERCRTGFCPGIGGPENVCCCNLGSDCLVGCGWVGACNPLDQSEQPGRCGACEDIFSHCCCYERITCRAYPCQNGVNGVPYSPDTTCPFAPAYRACPLGIPELVDPTIRELNQRLNEIQIRINGYLNQMNTEVVNGELRTSRQRLTKCVNEPYTEESVLRGEITAKWLFSCQSILDTKMPIHSYLGESLDNFQEGCYGNTYCMVRDQQGLPLPFPPGPCAEDYFCCQTSK